jgi:hypothetical protein
VDSDTIAKWLAVTAPIYFTITTFTTLLQVGITLWNLTIGLMIMVISLAIQFLKPLVIFVFVNFGDLFIEFMLFCVEIFQICVIGFAEVLEFLSGLNGSAEDFGPGFKGGLFDSDTFGAGADNDGEFGGVIGLFAPVSRLIIRFCQVIIRGFAKFFARTGVRMLIFADFIIGIVLKFLPIFIKILTKIIKILDPKGALGLFIYSMAYALYGIQLVIYGRCGEFRSMVLFMCTITSTINKALRKLKSKIGVSLDILPSCNRNDLVIDCGSKPKKPNFDTSSGAGLCDALQCSDDVLAIIAQLGVERPFCSDWVANGNSSIGCMNTVYTYSQANSTSIAKSNIDSISKELCFVLTAVIIAQCQNSLPPFGFSFSAITNDVCVADKSGLAPPAQTFNDGCACIYSAPLCQSSCCNQYALHTIGQIQSHIGGFQCGTILSQFPDEFWCQYDSLNSSSVPPNSDLTFSSGWCAAYRMVVEPACTFSSPIITLNALDITLLTADYTAQFCNSTVNQTGVCIRVDASTDPQYVQFQFEQTFIDAEMLFGSTNALNPAGFDGNFIITIPYPMDTTEEIIQKDIMKYYCYYHSLLFNSTNPVFSTRHRSILRVVGEFCDASLINAYASFGFSDFLGAKTRTPTGKLLPVTLIGIPSNVVVFGSVPSVPPPDGPDDSLDCVYETGATANEVADQSVCVSSTLVDAQSQMDVIETSGAESNTVLAENTQTFIPASHIVQGAPLDPNDPNYEQYATDQNTLEVAQGQPTDWNPVPASKQTDDTEVFVRIYTSGHTTGEREFTQRNLMSYKGEKEEDDEGPFKKKAWPVMASLQSAARRVMDASVKIMEKLTTSDPHSTKDESMFSEQNARKGKVVLLMALELLQKEVDDVRINKKDSSHPENFAGMRKLTSTWTEGAPALNATISALWDRLADSQASGMYSVSQAVLDEYYTSQVEEDVNYLFKHTMDGNLPNLLNFFYGLNYSAHDLGFGAGVNKDPDVDYSTNYGGSGAGDEFGGGGGNDDVVEECRNSFDKPLKCCKAGVSSYNCCKGLWPFCIRGLPWWLYATPQTKDNVDEQWRCAHFVGFFDYLWNSLRVATTVIFRWLSYATGDPGIYVKVFGGLVYPDLETPPNWFGCMVVYSTPVWISLLAVWLLFIIIASQRATQMSLLVMAKSDNIALWDKIQSIERELAMNRKLK